MNRPPVWIRTKFAAFERRCGSWPKQKPFCCRPIFLQEVEAMANRVVMINEGRLVYDGDVEGLRVRGNNDLDEAFFS